MRSLLYHFCLITIFITSLVSCAHPSDQLVGKWSATSVIQDKKALEIDLNLISFEFDQDGSYQFTSTLDYREAGAFQVTDNKLITKDTLKSQNEKSVLIEQLDSDTLKLKMRNPEGWMELTLTKD